MANKVSTAIDEIIAALQHLRDAIQEERLPRMSAPTTLLPSISPIAREIVQSLQLKSLSFDELYKHLLCVSLLNRQQVLDALGVLIESKIVCFDANLNKYYMAL